MGPPYIDHDVCIGHFAQKLTGRNSEPINVRFHVYLEILMFLVEIKSNRIQRASLKFKPFESKGKKK